MLRTELSADVVLGLVLTIAMMWTTMPPEFRTIRERYFRKRRRAIAAAARAVNRAG